MTGNVDDFMRRFGGEGTLDDREAAKYHDRFVSTHDEDRDFDNKTYHEGATEYLGKLPDNEFRSAARNAVSQAPPQEREGLLGGILEALGGSTAERGGAAAGLGGLSGIAKMLGLGSTDPRQMDDDDAAKVMDYTRKERPQVLRQTVEEKPWFVKAMGNPIVMGALTVVATKLLSNRRR
ncbi:MAG: hypothetical protein LC776_14285 [Acidobacteria bacterium]|nr:hypothetical protein [Acidobacteriota bacterium]